MYLLWNSARSQVGDLSLVVVCPGSTVDGGDEPLFPEGPLGGGFEPFDPEPDEGEEADEVRVEVAEAVEVDAAVVDVEAAFEEVVVEEDRVGVAEAVEVDAAVVDVGAAFEEVVVEESVGLAPAPPVLAAVTVVPTVGGLLPVYAYTGESMAGVYVAAYILARVPSG